MPASPRGVAERSESFKIMIAGGNHSMIKKPRTQKILACTIHRSILLRELRAAEQATRVIYKLPLSGAAAANEEHPLDLPTAGEGVYQIIPRSSGSQLR